MIVMNKRNIIIISILLLAFIVRLYGVSSEGVWLDESFSAYYSQKTPIDILTLDDPHPPLYNLLLHFFTGLFGISPVSLRFLSVLFGVASVFMVYLLGKELFSEKTGIITALILSLSPYHIFYSQEARSYSLLLFLSIVSMFFFVRYLDDKKRRTLVYYSLSTLLLVYSHYFALFVVLVQNIVFFIWVFKTREFDWLKSWALSQTALFLLSLPTLFNFLTQSSRVVGESWRSANNDLVFFTYYFSGGEFLNYLFPLLLIFLLFWLFKNNPSLSSKIKYSVLLNILWLSIPLLLAFLVSILVSPLFMTKYLIFCLVPYLILVSFSLGRINSKLRFFILGFIILISLFHIHAQVESQDKVSWNQVSAYVSELKTGNTKIILDPGYYLLPFSYYHDDSCYYTENIYECASENQVYTVWGFSEEEERFVDYAEGIIYITDGRKIDSGSGYFMFLSENFDLVSRKSFGITEEENLIEVYVFRK